MDWDRALRIWPELVTRTTADGVYIYVSAAARDLLGFDPQDMLGRHAADFVHPDDTAELVRGSRELARPSHRAVMTVRLRRARGGYRWVETTAISVMTGARSEIYACSRDADDRMEREMQLGTSVTRYRALLDALPEGVLLLGPDGAVDSANAAALRLLGRSAATLVGRRPPRPIELPGDVVRTSERVAVWTVAWRTRGAALRVRRQALLRHGTQDVLAEAIILTPVEPHDSPAGQHAGWAAPEGATTLTPREREVLRLLADGMNVGEIAEHLQVQLSTVRGYVKSLLAKLGAHNQLQAVVIALRSGLLPEIVIGEPG